MLRYSLQAICKNKAGFRNWDVFLVCAGIFFPHLPLFIYSPASSFLQLIFHGFQQINKGKMSDPSADFVSTVSMMPYSLLMQQFA